MVAAEERAEPWLLGIGPITGDDGPTDGVDSSGLGADLQAAINAAVAVATRASSQNRRGSAACTTAVERIFLFGEDSCLMFFTLNFRLVTLKISQKLLFCPVF